MGFFANIRHISRLASTDVGAHLGDIAVLKMDGVSMGVSTEHEPALAARPVASEPFDLEALGSLPDGTFGKEVATFMATNSLSPFVFTDEIDAPMRARNAYGIRVAQTHDLIHVLAGFDTSWPGEMGVYAVQYAQRWSPWSPLLAATTWLVYPWLTCFRLGTLRSAWRRGVAIGEAAPFLLAEPLEDLFTVPLAEVRARYGIAELAASKG